MLVIDPDECIDCAVCIPECPVSAIYAEEDLPPEQAHYAQLNAELKSTVARIDQLRRDIDAIVAAIEGEELDA